MTDITPADHGSDGATLERRVTEVEAALAQLPAKPNRTPHEQRSAQEALESCRELRRAFMARHAHHVYDVLTDGRSRYLRLAPLVQAAAERFPGLVPTPAQMDAERRLRQADKDGREIDQAIFFAELLRSPTSGPHLMDAMLQPVAEATGALEEFHDTGRVVLRSVVLERCGDTAHLTIHNEQCLNAEDNQLVADMETAVDLVALDDAVRVGVLRGAIMTHPRYRGRRVFSAGINLTQLRDGNVSFVDFLLAREMGCVSKLMHGVLTAPSRASRAERTVHKPWVAAVDSFAIGGGMQLLLVCDRVVAADDAYFSLPAAQEGIVPGLAGLRLAQATGARLARRIVLGGHVVRATDPEALLLCDEVVPADAMDAAIDRAARALASPAVAINRCLLNQAQEPPDLLRNYLAEFAIQQAARLYSEDVMATLDERHSRTRDGRREHT